MATARVAFGRGTLSLSTETANDRQQFIEHVVDCLRRWGKVEVAVDHASWMIERPAGTVQRCNRCGDLMDRAVCRHGRHSGALCCIVCALARPSLTAPMLRQLPADAVLRDVQAHAAYGNEWTPWMRWPRATPAEILNEMHLQRRFAPVLRFGCAEIQFANLAPLPKSINARSSRRTRQVRRA